MKINSPTYLIDKSKCLSNIQKMSIKAKANNLVFRPHFKTHQLAEIGEWYKNTGVDKITVSSIEMAKYFANHGWKDITIAFPLNILELDTIIQLANKIELNVLIDSVEVAEVLRDKIDIPLNYFIEIDTGDHRTGIELTNKKKIDTIISKTSENKNLSFSGFLTYPGNTYKATSKEQILSIHENSIKQLRELKNHYSKYFKHLIISIGDTPSCSLSNNFEGIDEIRPGNFVFYDWMQYKLGSCSIDEIAVAMVCPVVGKYPERNEIAIHGGAVHFSKEYILDYQLSESLPVKNFGQVIKKVPTFKKVEPLNDCYLSSISQEHGIIKCPDEFLEQTKIGDLVSIIPIHSCLTMNLMKENYIFI